MPGLHYNKIIHQVSKGMQVTNYNFKTAIEKNYHADYRASSSGRVAFLSLGNHTDT